MSSLSHVLRNFQVTLPKPIRKRFGVKEGDLIKIEETDRGILIIPLETVDRSQLWFWSKEWQSGEMEVEEEVKKGKVKKFSNLGDFLKDLKK